MLFLFLLLHFYRDIIAERFFFHIVAMYGIGPSATSAADVDVFALTAFPFVRFEVAQVIKYLRTFPNFTERNLLDISCRAVEVGAWLYVAETVNQAD
jgi:hypothetical protein